MRSIMNKFLPALTIFLGSLLLFGLQPMLGRMLLPSFGGTASVWVVCLCAYQVLLLAGYAYAHWIIEYSGTYNLKAKDKVLMRIHAKHVHFFLLAIAVLWCAGMGLCRPVLKPLLGASSYPALEVMLCVLVFIGVPYILLSANSSLVQAWVAQGLSREGEQEIKDGTASNRDGSKKEVYGLYAISNLGSFCGLLMYPFVLEPYISLSVQWYGFIVCLLIYTLLMAVLCRKIVIQQPTEARKEPARGSTRRAFYNESGRKIILWFLLPALSVFLLNAVTAHLTLDVMPLPLLWVLLLSLFLLSYTFGFTEWIVKYTQYLALLAMGFFVCLCYLQRSAINGTNWQVTLLLLCSFLFTGCIVLHAWLYQVRPATERLTQYYLFGALGGAMGGILASIFAPMFFKTVAEYPIALFVVSIMATTYLFIEWRRRAIGELWIPGLAILLFVCGCFLFKHGSFVETQSMVYKERGFFGAIRILKTKVDSAYGIDEVHTFAHGTTVHGIQIQTPSKERTPTTYYTPNAGGYAIVGHPKYRAGEPMRVNLIGLGVGVMFCYSRTNDYYHAYEISKEVLRVATNNTFFSFVTGSPAKTQVVLGDARKGLEKELAEGVEPYDVIILDAFTGDNIPYHLSTKEAFDLYFKLLKPDGILAVNISNWHLSLEPFMKVVGDYYHLPMLGFQTPPDPQKYILGSKFVFLTRTPEKMGALPANVFLINFEKVPSMTSFPTDEKGSFVGLLSCFWE